MNNLGRFACVCLFVFFAGLTVATPIANQYLRVNGPEWLTQAETKIEYRDVFKEVPAYYPPGTTTRAMVLEQVKVENKNSTYLDISCIMFGWVTGLTAFFFIWVLLASFEEEKKTITMAA